MPLEYVTSFCDGPPVSPEAEECYLSGRRLAVERVRGIHAKFDLENHVEDDFAEYCEISKLEDYAKSLRDSAKDRARVWLYQLDAGGSVTVSICDDDGQEVGEEIIERSPGCCHSYWLWEAGHEREIGFYRGFHQCSTIIRQRCDDLAKDHDLTTWQAIEWSVLFAEDEFLPSENGLPFPDYKRLLSPAGKAWIEGEAVVEGTPSETDCGLVSSIPGAMSACDLVEQFPEMRAPIIEGLLRRGEVANIIAAPKVGKSWLVAWLCLAVSVLGEWLGRKVVTGPVVIFDAELHKETLAYRLRIVADAMNVDLNELRDRIVIVPLRGDPTDIAGLARKLSKVRPGSIQLLVVDALYRFLPADADENSNAGMAAIFGQLDALAGQLDCAIALIHHASKGLQDGKSVTDVGSGAGAQSRAVDTHLVLRPHEEDGAIVLDAVARSWPPISPIALRRNFPIWELADDLDPSALRTARPRRKQKADEPPKSKPEPWSVERFATLFVSDQPSIRDNIIESAVAAGLSKAESLRMLRQAEDRGLAHRWHIGPKQSARFCNKPQPSLV